MRFEVKKYLFLGLEADRSLFFSQAQRLGIIHFLDGKSAPPRELPEGLPEYTAALRILRGQPVVEQIEEADYSLADSLVSRIREQEKRYERLQEERRALNLEIARVAPFGDFSLEDIAYIEKEGKRFVQFFTARQGERESLCEEPGLLPVTTQFGLDYYVSLAPEKRQHPHMVEMLIENPLGELLAQRAEREAEIASLHHALMEAARYQKFLGRALLRKLDHVHFETAADYAQNPQEGKLFAVQGWVPVSKLPLLQQLLAETGVIGEEIALEPADALPTYLENQGVARVGEDLVQLFDTPAHTDKDPSLWVLCFFALFFAIIVGDGGYGLIYLGVALYLGYRFSRLKTGAIHRFITLATILSVACVGWGVLSSSFFSLSVDLESPLRRFSLITRLAEKKAEYHLEQKDDSYRYWIEKYPEAATATDGWDLLAKASEEQEGMRNYELLSKHSDQVVLELTLVIAVIHLILSQLRYIRLNWSMAGWILFEIGGYLYCGYFLEATTMAQYLFGISSPLAGSAGWQLMGVGFVLAWILSLIQNRWSGLLEPMTGVQIFADTMSYLRLYALNLSGAMLGATINEMAFGMPMVFSAIFLVLGHSLNMLLCIMGGVIHGLRLNFLEWYHYSFHGGGKPFKPLALNELE